jgi:hypothetical protein
MPDAGKNGTIINASDNINFLQKSVMMYDLFFSKS